jgi:hypothetical protein
VAKRELINAPEEEVIESCGNVIADLGFVNAG